MAPDPSAPLAQRLGERLERASARMRQSCAGLSDEELRLQFDPEFSPIGWHFGHVAWQEEYWVLRRFAGRPPLEPGYDEVFDSFQPDKEARGTRLPPRAVLDDYRRMVRTGVLECVAALLEQPFSAPMRGAGLLSFVANHESQHAETVLAIRLAGALGLDPKLSSPPEPCTRTGFAAHAGGRFTMGTSLDPERWDNEAPAHQVPLAPFELAESPVSNAEWHEFMREGGYAREALWSVEGFRFCADAGIGAPLYWFRDASGAWCERTLAGEGPLDPERPVCHVSWHEAQAFAKYRGARLARESEWEYAMRGGACGKRVWEWTSDAVRPYPGFEAQPYSGYSAPWFDGAHRVARGGASMTEPEIARPTFRNWYLPHMRRAFLGLRLARDPA